MLQKRSAEEILRMGRNEELKQNTTYFTPDWEAPIERKESFRDLGVEWDEAAEVKGGQEGRAKGGLGVKNVRVQGQGDHEDPVEDAGPAGLGLRRAGVGPNEPEGEPEVAGGAAKEVHEEGGRDEGPPVSRETEATQVTVLPKTIGEIQNYLYLEVPGGTSSWIQDTREPGGWAEERVDREDTCTSISQECEHEDAVGEVDLCGGTQAVQRAPQPPEEAGHLRGLLQMSAGRMAGHHMQNSSLRIV